MLFVVVLSTESARADCAKRHVYLSLASDAAQHMSVYIGEGQFDMGRAAMDEGKHWYDMALDEVCHGGSLADDDLDHRLYRILFADNIRRGQQVMHQEALDAARQHKAEVAAAWARKHPSKWVIAHPGQTPSPYAGQPDRPASIVRAVEPDIPPLAVQGGISGTVEVQVSLDDRGNVIDAVVTLSTSPILNDAALSAARRSTYQPEIKNGKGVATKYIFSVSFEIQ